MASTTEGNDFPADRTSPAASENGPQASTSTCSSARTTPGASGRGGRNSSSRSPSVALLALALAACSAAIYSWNIWTDAGIFAVFKDVDLDSRPVLPNLPPDGGDGGVDGEGEGEGNNSTTGVSPTVRGRSGDDDDDGDSWGSSDDRQRRKEALLDELIWGDDMTPSVRTLLGVLKTHSPPVGGGSDSHAVDHGEEAARCRRYGYGYDANRTDEFGKRRRRIFLGGLIADDSWHAIGAHAAEAYGLYHVVSFVESNRTQMLYERDVRFGPGSLDLRVLQSGIFGPDTIVEVDQYVDDPTEVAEGSAANGLLREHLQREVILEMWRRNGMRPDDIGLVSDADETFTRDFLLAAKSCDVPRFRPGQDCREPKILAKGLVFEASPECITDTREWYHPDMIIGECVDTIGDSRLHRPGKREYRGNLGNRSPGYGRHSDDYQSMPENTTMFPLWKPVDFRATAGGEQPGDSTVVNGTILKYTGYRFHNFFESIEVLRWKYKTYGHPIMDADVRPLRRFHEDVNLTIHCVTDRPDIGDWRRKEGGYDALVGPRPLIFEYGEYRRARQQELRNMTLEDEAKYGRRHRHRRQRR